MKFFDKIKPQHIVLTAFFLFFIFWYRSLLTSEYLTSSDLITHINNIEKFREFWYRGVFSYYDPTTFTGWPALIFYGYFPHLITALLSYPVELFTAQNAVTLTVNSLIVVLGSGLVYTLYFAASPFIDDLFEDFGGSYADKKVIVKTVFAFTTGCFCYWFLNYDFKVVGIGLASPSFVGLYGQLWGWHMFLLYIGLMGRIYREDSRLYVVLLSAVIALNFLCHTNSAVFSMMFGLLCLIWFSKKRWTVVKAHIAGLGLLFFWLAPFLTYVSDYSVYHPLVRYDFMELFLRYPFIMLLKSFLFTLSGEFVLINYFQIIVLILLLTALASKNIRKSYLAPGFILISLILLLFSSTNFSIRSIPVGIHYYRFYALIFLFWVMILPVIAMVYLKVTIDKGKNPVIGAAVITAVFLFGFISNLVTPQFDFNRHKTETVQNAELFNNQKEVLDYFKGLGSGARVFTEYLYDYEKFPPVYSHNYINDQLYKVAGQEPIGGVQVLQSKAYRYIFENFKYLEADSYGPQRIIKRDKIKKDYDTTIRQLRDFGVTHIIAGNDVFYDNIRGYSIDEPEVIGNYRIVNIQNHPYKKIETSDRELIGYYDKKGGLPFSLIDYYFFFSKNLSNKFTLINIEDPKDLPQQINTLIVNSSPGEFDKIQSQLKGKELIGIDFAENYIKIDHYDPLPKDEENVGLEYAQFQELRAYLNGNKEFQSRMLQKLKNSVKIENPKGDDSPELSWGNDHQSFLLTGLVPGQVYRINYSYFPYWHPESGKLYRGSGERMFYIADSENTEFRFTRLRSKSTWIGWAVTVLSVFYLIWFYRRNGR